MCQSKPGLRCTANARAVLESRRARLSELLEKYNAVKNGRNRELKDTLLIRIDAMQAKVASAERDYYSTTGGIEELESRVADESLPEEDRSLAEAALELARYDRETLSMAHTIYKRVREGEVQHIQSLRDSLAEKESRAAELLARATNSRDPGVSAARKNAEKARSERVIAEEFLRRLTAGVSNGSLKRATVASITAPTAQGESRTSRAFVSLSPADFGRAAPYFPYGAYGEVTDTRVDSNGNYELQIEDSRWIRVSGSKSILTHQA